MKERKKFLKYYAIGIIVLLILIMFIIPDSFFSKKYENNFNNLINNSTEEPEQATTAYTDFKEQQEHLKKNNYTYSYQLLAYASDKATYMYNCKGTILNGKEEGLCTKPKNIDYTEKDKKEKLTYVNINYLNPSYIFDLIKDIEVEPIDYTGLRVFIYNVKIDGLDTEIQISTTKEEINQIQINNVKDTYVLKYSDITY